MIRNKILCFCLFCCIQWMFIYAQTLDPVKQLLQTPYMRGASFSLIVKDLQTGKNLFVYDMDRQLSPASVLKVVTTATALEVLGEDYRYPTSLQYDGVIKEGVLEGNLYIKGSGDPSLGSSHFAPRQNQFWDTWITALQKIGIRRIKGAVISDESIFDTEGASVKWLREDMGNYYAPGCYGLSVFDNLYKLSLRTGRVGSSPVILSTSPDVSFIQFKNYLKAVSASSDSAYIIGAPLESVRYLYGTLPANREQYVIKGDIPDPALFMAQYLTTSLQKKGIIVEGTPSCYRLEMEQRRWTNRERQTIVTTYSPPLREIVRVCNHVSHNLYADALLKTVGLQYKTREHEVISSFGRGITVIKNYWKEKGIDVFPLKMNDGSGLAPTNKISAAFIGDLLVYMATQSKVSEAFVSSLPKAGVEGSVRSFLKETPLQGKAFLKSGGITGVRCYVGYIQKENKTYAVAVLSNNYSCSMRQMTKELERLLVRLLQ